MWECGPTVPSGVRPLQNSEPLLEPLQVIEAIAPTSSNRRWWFLTFSVHLPVLNLWSFLFSVFLFVCLFFLPWWLIWLKKKNPPAVHKTWSGSLGQEDPLEKRMAIHSNILAWKIPWTEEGCSPRSGKQLDMTEWLTLSLFFTSFYSGFFLVFTELFPSPLTLPPLSPPLLLFSLLSWTLHKSQSSNKEAQSLTKRQDQVCCWRWGVDFLLSWFSVAFYQPVLYHPLLFCLHATYLWNFQNKSLILKCTSYIFKDDQRQKSKRKFPFVS